MGCARGGALVLGLLLAAGSVVRAQTTYYWDNNGATAGFGAAGGTWAAPTPGGTTGWSTDNTGASAIGSVTTTTGDTLYFGFDPAALGSGTVTVSGTQAAGNIRFGNGSGAIALTGGTIDMSSGGNATIWAQTSGGATALNTHTIDSNISKTDGTSRMLRFGTQNTTDEIYNINGDISGNCWMEVRMRNYVGITALNGLNSFGGNVSLVTGQLNVNSVANIGASCSLGAGSAFGMAGGGGQAPFLWYTGSVAGSTDRAINISGGGNVRIVSQDAPLTLAGNITGTKATFQTALKLSGDAGGGANFNEISGVLGSNVRVNIENATPDGPGTHAEAGRWLFSNNNSYSGTTTIAASSILKITHSGALGDTLQGTTVSAGGTLELGHSGGVPEAITIHGNGVGGIGAIYSTGADSDMGGTLTLGSDATIGGTARIDIWGQITDGGGGYTLTKKGTFGFVPSGAANYTHLLVDEGTITVNGNSALPGGPGTTVTNNTEITLWSNRTIANSPNVTCNDGSRYQASRSVANSSSINGTMLLNGAVSFNSWRTEHTMYSAISGTGSLTVKSIVNNPDDAKYIFAGNNTYSASTTVGTGASGVGKMTLEAGSNSGLSPNSAHTVTANSTLRLNGYNGSIGSLAGAGAVENGGYASPLEDDFSSANVTYWSARVWEDQIDSGWITCANTEWFVGGGVITNAATTAGGYPAAKPAEGALAQVVSNTHDGDAVTLEFDYDVAAGDTLYANFWGYTGTVSGLDAMMMNTEPCNGNCSNLEGGSFTTLDTFNLKDGATSFNGSPSTSISGGLTGFGTYSVTITIADLGIAGVDSLADFSYIGLVFCKEEDGTAGTTSIDNVRVLPDPSISTLTAGADGSSTTFSGVMQDGSVDGALGLTKNGSGVMTLSGPNTYTGPTTVLAGTLRLGADNVLADTTDVVLAGGTLEAAAATDTIGSLNVTANSTLELGSGNLTFGDSRGHTWTGHLTLSGTLGATALRFPDSLNSSQLMSMSNDGGPVDIDSNGYIVKAAQGTVVMIR